MSIADQIAEVREHIAAACARVHRPIESVTLVAVSKTHSAPLLIEAALAGIRDFGENRVEEADKIGVVEQAIARENSAATLSWHMIGHVQSRKARDVLAHYQWIHSLDSFKLAEKYARLLPLSSASNAAPPEPLNVLLEMNVSGEVSKEGLDASQWDSSTAQRESLWNEVRRIIELPHLRVRGLMTVAPNTEGADSEATRPVFAKLRRLQTALAADFPGAPWDTLSMGMTDDYAVAIEEGATMIRVGRAIFGARQPL